MLAKFYQKSLGNLKENLNENFMVYNGLNQEDRSLQLLLFQE